MLLLICCISDFSSIEPSSELLMNTADKNWPRVLKGSSSSICVYSSFPLSVRVFYDNLLIFATPFIIRLSNEHTFSTYFTGRKISSYRPFIDERRRAEGISNDNLREGGWDPYSEVRPSTGDISGEAQRWSKAVSKCEWGRSRWIMLCKCQRDTHECERMGDLTQGRSRVAAIKQDLREYLYQRYETSLLPISIHS